jgi:Protein of unknown function (DUF3303)
MTVQSLGQKLLISCLRSISSGIPARRRPRRTGVAIVESDDLAAVHRWIGQWNPYMDIDITPVVDDEESAAIGRPIVADNNA